MEFQKVQPLVVAAASTGDGVIEFRTKTERLIVDDQVTLINVILRFCDGRNTVATISKKVVRSMKVDAELVHAIINDLLAIEVVVDSRRYAVHTHMSGNNPMFYSHPLSDEDVERIYNNRPSYLVDHQNTLSSVTPHDESHLRRLLSKRSSCRSFGDESISRDDFIAICEMAYGTELGPVPSGGALYPLSLFLIVMRDGEEIGSGVYQYNPRANSLNLVQAPADEADTMYALNSDTLLHEAAGIIVIAGDLERHPSKYANRGYRYTLIEAGHVAQCVNLSAIELGYSVLEYGGFNDEPLKQLLHIESDDVWPLVCVAVGHADGSIEAKETGDTTTRKALEESLVGKRKPLNWATILYKETGSNTPFYSAAAHYKPGSFHDAAKSYQSRIAAGTSPSQDLALIKAMAEGYERYSFAQPREDVIASALDLDAPWVDPDLYVPFTEWQRKRLGFGRFDSEAEWQWVKGEDSNGSLVYVPTDLVFYPYNAERHGRQLCYEAHSNGCAAHTTLEVAKQNAVHELLERDAVIRNWLLQVVPNRIPDDLLPLHWRQRVVFWRRQGWKVDAVDFSHSGVAIVSVYARKEKARPYLAHGSAASSVSYDFAVDKAFQELEIAMSVQSGRRAKRVRPEKVDTPNDHGQVYHFDDYAHKLDYLFDGSFIEEMPSTGGPDVLKSFDPVYVTVSPEDAPLWVVRALSAKLIPINFGYGRDHISHNSVKESVDQTSTPFPHYLA